MDSNKPIVVVFSRDYPSALSVIRSLGAAGYTVDLFAAATSRGAMDVAAESRYVRECVDVTIPKGNAGRYNTRLVNALIAHSEKQAVKPVLLPTGEFATRVIDRNREALEPYFIMPGLVGGENQTLSSLSRKSVQMQLAETAGIRIRMAWNFDAAEVPVLPDEMVFPCVCTRISQKDGRKMRSAVCDDEEEFYRYFAKLRKNHASGVVHVLEYLETAEEIEVPGLCLDQQIIIPGIIRKRHATKVRGRHSRIGVVSATSMLGDIEPCLKAMLKDLHYVGLFSVRLKQTDNGLCFSKLNLSCGRANFAFYKCGVNSAAAFVDYLVDGKIPDLPPLTTGKRFLDETSIWKDFTKNRITRKQLDALLNVADITVICDDEDPKPGALFHTKMNAAAKKIKVKRFRSKLGAIKRKVLGVLGKVKRKVVKPLRKIKYWMLGYPQMKKCNARDPLSDIPRVLVVGRNYCSNLCLARAFGSAGYEVEILRIFQAKPKLLDVMKILKPDAYSKYVKAYHTIVTRFRSKNIVKKLIAIADPNCKMLLVPADDLVANTVDANMKKLRKYYILPNVDNRHGEINRLMGKNIQKELAEQAGLPVINSCVIKTEDGEFTIPETVTYPCFMKPNISKNGLKSRMRRCDSEEELTYWLKEYSRTKDVEMLVQDYIEIGREYSILGVSTKDGAIGPGFFGALEGGNAGRRGVALTGEVVDSAVRQQLIDDIIAFVGTLGFEGLFDVDLIETVDGKMYFVELNMRFGGSGYAITASGVNLPGIYADYMLQGKPVDLSCKLTEPGKHFVSEKIMLEEYMEGFLTKEELREHMAKADIHFIQDDQDPKPYKHFKKFYPIASVYRVRNQRRARKEAAAAAATNAAQA